MRTKTPALLLGAVALLAATACTDHAPATTPGDARALTVTATDTACQVSAATAPSGTLTFSVTNSGTKVNEFYLIASDGLRIVAEVENIGPGLTRDLVLSAPAGDYFSACKPGMVGEGIRAAFAVSDSGVPVGPTGDDAALVAAANTAYGSYVRDQVDQLLTGTQAFVDAYTAGDDDLARSLYAPTRVHWERVEPVAESFGDLDPKMDLREADLEEGQEWTGWHLIEKDLWPARAKDYTPLTTAERATYAKDLLDNTQTLYDRTRDLTYTADGIANGAKGLLDEVATGKVTGEEEYWSRTDLWDFQANVDGARVAWQGLHDLLVRKDAALDTTIATRFDELQKLLDAQKQGDGFVLYDELTTAQVKELSDAVNALSEPLSKLAAAVLK
jgi:iron uptake system component EfeO